MFYDRFLRRRTSNTVIPLRHMLTSEGVIFFGEDPGVIGMEIPPHVELSDNNGNLS